jgi:hypothetical protein
MATPNPDDVRDTMANIAKRGIASASGDEGSVSTMSITQLIEADRYLRSQGVSADPFKCIRKKTVENGGAMPG